MLVERFGEDMAARAVGDKIKIARRRRMRGGFKRGAARIGDRSRRETVDGVGVVGRPLLDLAAQDRPAERRFAADEAVDDRGIRLKAHALAQPIDEHGGDARPLLVLARLLFNDRRKRHQFIGRAQRQVRRALRPDRFERLALILLHLGEETSPRVAARIFVCLRQQSAFLRQIDDIARQQFGLFQFLHNLFRRQAFRNGHAVHDLTAGGDLIDHVAQADVFLEAVFARLQLAELAFENQPQLHERRIGDDAFALELRDDLEQVAAGRNIDDLVGRERARLLQLVRRGDDAEDAGDQRDKHKTQ